jgi:hypothetical protein
VYSLISPHLATLSMDSDDGSMTSESSGPSEEDTKVHDDAELDGNNGIENDRIEKLARSYRHHLSHNFDDRLREPLWQPLSCQIADIGYITPTGSFCVLFNVSSACHRLSVRFANISSSRRKRVRLLIHRSRYRSHYWPTLITRMESLKRAFRCGTPLYAQSIV